MNKPGTLRGRELTNLRLSGAAGTHGKKTKDRANTKRKVIEQARRDHERLS
jgi:hypothetical protein